MSKLYNPPPTWPRPPEGWTPPPGWTPDPSWGPAPEGWQFWLEEVDAKAPWARPESESKRPRRNIALSFGAVSLLVLVGVVIAALATGGKFKEVQVSADDGVRVSFDNGASGSDGVTPEQVEQAQSGLEQRVATLEAQAQSGSGADDQAGVDVSGTWQGDNGYTYTIEQYGTEVVWSEEVPGYGITAVGYGSITGDTVDSDYVAVDGSTGVAQFVINGSTIDAGFANELAPQPTYTTLR